MVVVMQEGATEEQIQSVISKLMEMGFDIHRSTGVAQTVLGAVGVKPEGGADFRARLCVAKTRASPRAPQASGMPPA